MKREKTIKGKRKNLSNLTYWMLILGISLILSAMIIYSFNEVFSLVKPDIVATVHIPEKASTSQVSAILKKERIIGSRLLFGLYNTFADDNKEYKPGDYELSAQMDYREITSKIKRTTPTRDVTKVTIPEGYTFLQTIDILDEKLDCTKEELLAAAQDENLDFSFLEEQDSDVLYRLEGFLFPDTYEFYKDEDPLNVLSRMLKNFDKKLDDDLRTLVQDSEYSLNELITIAALIEKEAKMDNEREIIASVIYNRLADSANFPYLQVDASLLYTMAEHKPVLTNEDKEIDTPYNTYKNKGLPPGPICSPGLKSIVAALAPDETNYYYYNAKSDGTHYFSKTLEEHNANIAKAKAAN